jgi:hypothetical protein
LGYFGRVCVELFGESCRRFIDWKGRFTALKCALNRLDKSLALETEELGQSLEIVEVFHARIRNSKLDHGLKFFGNNRLSRALVQIAFYRFSACHLLWSILQNARKNTISPTFIPQPEAQFSLFAPEPPNSHNVVFHNNRDNKLHEGTKFSWDTFGVHIESTVHEFVPNSRIGWWGLGTGMKAYHTFLLIKPTRVATSSPKRS